MSAHLIKGSRRDGLGQVAVGMAVTSVIRHAGLGKGGEGALDVETGVLPA